MSAAQQQGGLGAPHSWQPKRRLPHAPLAAAYSHAANHTPLPQPIIHTHSAPQQAWPNSLPQHPAWKGGGGGGGAPRGRWRGTGGRNFHSHAARHQTPPHQADAKRRKLPHFLSPEEADVEAAEAALLARQMPPARSPLAPVAGVPAAAAAAAAAVVPHFVRMNPPLQHNNHVSYLPGPAKCDLPVHFSVSYAHNRALSDLHATELLQLLRAELDDRAAPATSQRSPAGASCECPVVVGLDCEWRPNFVKGQAQNPVALLQLSTPTRAYLFQVIHWALPRRLPPTASQAELKAAQHAAAIQNLGPSLAAILLDPRILKAGIGVKGDVSKFYLDYGLEVKGALDLSDYANERLDEAEGGAGAASATFERRNWSLAALVTHTLQVELSKPKKVRMSNWESPLTPQQQRYAALDAYASLAIFDRLHQTHLTQRNCTRAIAVATGSAKRAPHSSNNLVAVEVVVRPSSSPSATQPASPAPSSRKADPIDLTLDSGEKARRPGRSLSSSQRSRSFEIVDE